jgi:uncharacterized surface protein with fasciclin (FAS1) repeats
MGLTAEEALRRPFLLRALISYHGVPEQQITSKQIRGRTIRATSATLEPLVLQSNSQGVLTATDVQGNAATVVQPDLAAGAAIVHGIDHVLLNGEYLSHLWSGCLARTLNTFVLPYLAAASWQTKYGTMQYNLGD